MIKNLNLNQLRSNSDHKGWLYYLRELNQISSVKKSSPNFEELKQSNEPLKWRENYLILKHELLYFYLKDEDEQQPCRIVNLPTFELDNNLQFKNSLHIFKIKSAKCSFLFASKDLNSLSEWIIKFKCIFNLKKINDESNLMSKKPIVNSSFKPAQYHSFNTNHHSSYVNNQFSNANQLGKPTKQLAHSVRDLNLDENDKMNYLNGLMSKSSTQIVFNNRQLNNCSQLNDENQENKQLNNNNKLSTKQHFNNGIRSQSCVDSNLLSKYAKARLLSKEAKSNQLNYQLSNQSINQLTTTNDCTYNSFLPPSSLKSSSPQITPKQQQFKKCYKSMNDFYSDQQYSLNDSFDQQELNKQNQINQLNEQNQLNKQQEQQINQKMIMQKATPKPQPRISKMKEQNSNNANFVGKIINEFDQLSKYCQNELDHYSSLRKRNSNLNNKILNEMNKINSSFNSYPRSQTASINRKDEQQKKNETNLADTTNKNQQQSLLDREYNRLFSKSSPANIKTATSKEIQSIYLKQQQHDQQQIEATTKNTINLDRLRCNSPISDHSLSSSSGISSYYSMGQDVQTKYLANLSTELDNNAYSSNASTNFSFSPTSKNSSFNQSIEQLDSVNKKNDQNLKLNEKDATKKEEKKVHRKSSFRLFGSSKVLSKLSSSKSSPEENEKSSLKRSFFGGLRKKNSLPTNVNSTAVQTEDKSPNQFSNQLSNQLQSNQINHPSFLNSHHLNRIKSKSSELLNNYYMDQLNQTRADLIANKLVDNYEFSNSGVQQPQTPETPRNLKPTMGIMGLLSKRRSSSVSVDKMAISEAFKIYNEKIENRVP